jgi:hypothetical protein
MARQTFKLVLEGFKMSHHTNEKAPGVIKTVGLKTGITNDLNFAAGTLHNIAIATQIAELAILGQGVQQFKDGGFLICKDGHSILAIDLTELQAFARRLGVSQ